MLKYRLKCQCVCECVLYLVSCVALHTVNYCEACLTVTSCLGHGVFWGHTLTHIHTNGCTSCSIWPDLALESLRSVLSIFLCLHCIRVCLWLSFIRLVFVLWWKTTTAIKPQVSTNSVYFFIVDVILHTCDCPEMAQIASPAVSKALGLFASAVYMSDFLTALRSPLLGRMRIDLENLWWVNLKSCPGRNGVQNHKKQYKIVFSIRTFFLFFALLQDFT